jgi:sugar lactone lactonase YvrE
MSLVRANDLLFGASGSCDVEDVLVARRRTRPVVLTLFAALVAIAGLAADAQAAQLSGRVVAGSRPVDAARVTLYASGASAAAQLASATTDSRGTFRLSYTSPRRGAVVYAIASGGRMPARRALRFMAVADPADGSPRRLTLNELTTVASVYSLSRFLHGVKLTGPSPGLPNAAATVPSLVRPATGKVGSALANSPNGTSTNALATFRTLAALLGGCTTGTPRDCRALFRAATPPRGSRPTDTLGAIHDIALNPVNHVRRIFRLPKSRAYRPTLSKPPSSWVLTLKHTDGGYDGPGRMAFDSHGNIWVTNNFQPPGTDAGLYVISLDPTGRPRNGGAVSGGGIQGNWWGIAVDRLDRVWLSNFTGDDTAAWNSPDFQGGNAAALFTKNARALSNKTGITAGNLHAPQGIAVDQNNNTWIANHGNNTVTVYPKGDPLKARVISGGGLYNPFTIAIDARGNAWVNNGSLAPSTPGSLTRIAPDGNPNGTFEPGRMRSPQGMAIDSAGNLWIASLVDSNVTWLAPNGKVKGRFRAPSIEGAWGVAIDGDDNVWVASFVGQKITLLCGRIASHCPPGAKTGDPLSPALHGFTNGGLQHITAVQVDQSGNVWAANNWAQISPTVGGDGLVEFIGAAPPVKTPMIGPPQQPSTPRGR